MSLSFSPYREFGFLLSDSARALRTVVDQRAREFGMTRAQWSVLARIQRNEGLSQSDLAAEIDIAPITLARLIDRLAATGLVERRPDPADRRINRLYLTPAAVPVLERLATTGDEVMRQALSGFDTATVATLSSHLMTIRSNLKACQKRSMTKLDNGDEDE
jgi:MarR family transcriptional regulator, transcriptional regulator for hemolysin